MADESRWNSLEQQAMVRLSKLRNLTFNELLHFRTEGVALSIDGAPATINSRIHKDSETSLVAVVEDNLHETGFFKFVTTDRIGFRLDSDGTIEDLEFGDLEFYR